MKYWAYFGAKLAVTAGFLWLVWKGMNALLPEPQLFLYTRVSRFPQDLPWTLAMLLFWLLTVGLVYLCVWDQRRRCRTCLRVLMMPVEIGSWSMATLFGPPKIESICPYGHGTLKVLEVHLTGSNEPEWQSHGDMWRELEELESGRK